MYFVLSEILIVVLQMNSHALFPFGVILYLYCGYFVSYWDQVGVLH